LYYDKFAIIGGDLRNLALAEHLRADGKTAVVYGFEKQKPPIAATAPLAQILQESEVVIGATPCSSSPDILNAPFHNGRLTAAAVLSMMREKQIFIAGRIPQTLLDMAAARGIKVCDILEREEMAILNAIPTAEGAIQLAFERMKITLHGANALILGYGRIGKILAKMLQGIGARVYVAARKPQDAAALRSFGHIHVPYDALDRHLGQMDVIFNTVPHMILDRTNLKFVHRQSVLIDMASRPFGIDFEASKEEKLDVVWAPSLPGKVAPVTAARYMQETIYSILQETGEGQ